MPITDRGKLKEGGWAQVRAALQRFEGDVTEAVFDKWGGSPPREYLGIECKDVKVLEASEELSMDIEAEGFSFRINTSEATGTMWDAFLESADKQKLLVPDGLVGKRIVFKKRTIEGSEPQYTSSNFVLESVVVKEKAPAAKSVPATGQVQSGATQDTMGLLLALAVGKTEEQFRMAANISPNIVGPYKALAKSGALTASFVAEGKLVQNEEGGKIVYQLPA